MANLDLSLFSRGIFMRFRCIQLVALALMTISTAYAGEPKAKGDAATDWNRSTAAKYLDARQQWWMDWPKAQRDHDTSCVSCHTVLPYAMGRSSMHTGLQA